MARHHFINNDLELFLNADAKEFKKKISKRVFSPWQSSVDENDLIFLHMILARAITDHQLKSPVIHDWKTIFEKLTASGYTFTSEDYFPDVHGRHLYIDPATADGIHSYFDMLNEPQYLEMIKELHASGVAIDESELHKSLKKYGYVSKTVTDFFSSVGFNLDTVLTEISVDNEIKSLTKSGYDASLLNLDHAQKGISKKLDDYKKEQSLKSDRIKDYLNTHEISPERANELYKCFSVSYEKMETYPEFKGRYLADICCFYHCANELKTEAFFMDVQVDLIKLLEAKNNIKFLQEHAVGSHRSIGETAGKKESLGTLMNINNHYGSRTELSKDFILTPKQYYAFEKFENSFPYPMKHDKNTEKFTIGFREFNQTETFASHLFSNNMDLSHKVLFRAMDTTYREFETYLSTVVERNLKNVTLNSLFERVYGVFQLKETYELFSDIDYYELCYSTNLTASGHAYYLFRFYLEDIEPSCVLEDKKSKSMFQYQTDKQEAARPKIIISTHYKNMEVINRLFLSNYKRELAEKFECSIEDVNDDMMDLFDMTVI